jgi:hypothetical protein
MKNKRIKLILITVIFISVFLQLGFTQQNVGIGTENPDESALLDMVATDKGLLIPRLTTAQKTAISNPAEGLLVFDNDLKTFWYYSSNSWIEIKKDNLGDHIATQALQMSGHEIALSGGWLSMDGEEEGVYVNTTGQVGINKIPIHALDVNGNVNSSGIITNNFQLNPMGPTTIGHVLTSDGYNASWQAQTGDNLGNHVATQQIQMNNNYIQNVGQLHLNGHLKDQQNTTGAFGAISKSWCKTVLFGVMHPLMK